MKLIVATSNMGKLQEFQRILQPLGFELLSQKEAGADLEVEETGETFAQNAYIKAKAIFDATGLPTVADDSGLCVTALDLRPGVYSARYCGEESSYQHKMQSILKELQDVPTEQRTAYFESAICCILDKDTILNCHGRCYGTIGYAPTGEGGFGYDPIFMTDGKTYAQLSGEEKDKISHRGLALQELSRLLRQQ